MTERRRRRRTSLCSRGEGIKGMMSRQTSLPGGSKGLSRYWTVGSAVSFVLGS